MSMKRRSIRTLVQEQEGERQIDPSTPEQYMEAPLVQEESSPEKKAQHTKQPERIKPGFSLRKVLFDS